MRYFIAHVLDGRDNDAVEILRREIGSAFSVSAALRIPPHLTLLYPFETDNVRPLETELARLVKTRRAFSLDATGFNSFDDAVWFIDVDQRPELFDIKKDIAGAVKRTLGIDEPRKNSDVHFHITLAYKDVTPETFRRIGDFLKTRRVPIRTLSVDAIALLEHDDERWNVRASFPLEG